MIELKSYWPLIIGGILLCVWSLDYWKVFSKTKLYLSKHAKKVSSSFRGGNYILGFIGLVLISYSACLPRKELKVIPGAIEVNDVFIVFDVSRSMLAEDMHPNRLEVAKEKLRDFASLRPTDRIGVIVFAEKVFTLLPLTTDPELIYQIISEINVGVFGSGTNIGDALGLAVARLNESKTKNKVVILLTDGVNNVGNMTPLAAAEMAKEQNIKVYTITLATDEDARLPIGQVFFGMQYQTIPGGSYDLKTMKEIADMTGGKTYMATEQDSLEKILAEIQELEKTEIETHSLVVYVELYFKYLLMGVILFLAHEIFRRSILREIA